MFLKCSVRKKDGKEHRSWSIVESRRVNRTRTVHRHVLYLGELSDSQHRSWQKAIGVFDESTGAEQQMVLFPEDRLPLLDGSVDALHLRVSALRLERPRQWGACWLADVLWRRLELDTFFAQHVRRSREGTDWAAVLRILTIYRLLAPGSEWRLHREWFARSALADLLGVDECAAQDDTLYRAHDRVLKHRDALFAHLRQRWVALFNVRYEVLLYDLTSTYFECDVPEDPNDPRRFGHSRDRRSDCVQVVVALVVTPEGLPLAYEMLPGNTSDKTTLRDMLGKVRARYGAAERIWLMDRGIPTEEVLAEMRASTPPVHYLVGTPKGRLTRLESALAEKPWLSAREKVRVKLHDAEGELYVLAESVPRKDKERAMRQRKLKRYWKRLGELKTQLLDRPMSRDDLLEKIGAAKDRAGRQTAALVRVAVTAAKLRSVKKSEPPATENPTGKAKKKRAVPKQDPEMVGAEALSYTLDKTRLRRVRIREGCYLLRTNMAGRDPGQIWQYYMQLVAVEEAFRTLKGDLGLRPIFHKKPSRIEAHLFIAFLSYCLSITLRQQLRGLSGGLMPRTVFEKLATVQMLDVRIPTTDGRELLLTRHTEPSHDVNLLLDALKLALPPQPPPRISQKQPLPCPLV
jgi:transposase